MTSVCDLRTRRHGRRLFATGTAALGLGLALLVPMGLPPSATAAASVPPAALPLQEFIPNGNNGRTWNAYNDTVYGSGPAGIGDDVAYLDPEDGLVHVFMRAANGHLAEYVNDAKTANQVWSVYDLTSLSGGSTLVTGVPDPVYYPSQGTLHVFVQAANGDMVDFTDDHAAGRIWNVYEISAVANRGGSITSRPDAVAGSILHVYVRSGSGDLVEYDNDGVGGYVWSVYDHSTDAGKGSAIASDPATLVVGGINHVYVEAASGDLVEYDNDGIAGHVWNAYDESTGPGGDGPITGTPDPVQFGPLAHVYVRVASGDLVEYVNDGAGGHTWNAYDQSLASGGGGPFVGVADAIPVGQYMEVYVRTPSNALVEYINDGVGGHVWNAYNQTAASQGPTIGTDASAVTWGGLVHVYAGGPMPPGGPTRTGVGVYGFASNTPTAQAITDGWPIIGDTGGLGTLCPPYAQALASNPDLQIGQAIDSTQVRVTWLSFWTVSGPAQQNALQSPGDATYVQQNCPSNTDTWYSAGYQGGQTAATQIDYDANRYDAIRPDWLILDPEGYSTPPWTTPGQSGATQDAQEWTQFISGWADGVVSVDSSLHPAFYVNQSQYFDNGLSSVNLPAFVAVAPICFDPSGQNLCGVNGSTPNQPFSSGGGFGSPGANVYGYIAYYGGCPAGPYEDVVRNWGAPYDTLQFQSGTYCAP